MEKMTAALLVLCACGNVDGLTSEDLYGLNPNPRVWLSGLVTNARTGAPLSGVSVQVDGNSTTSNGAGAYRLEGLSTSQGTGSASVHGYQVYTLSLQLRAGANARDIALEPQECGRFTCDSGEFCRNDACVPAASLSGGVTSACDGSALDARVTIDGKSTCSSASSGKTFFELEGLTPGGPQTLSAGKTGWQALTVTVTLQPGFNVAPRLELIPIGGCSAAPPADVRCTCTQANCQ